MKTPQIPQVSSILRTFDTIIITNSTSRTPTPNNSSNTASAINLVRAEPAELHHGYSQYHWDGYLWWTDDLNPRYAEYSLQTNRPEDFYWSVNQTRLYPQATEEPGVLEVQVESVTPNLSHFLVRMDGGEWVPDETPVRWPLHPGENSLAVRSVNAFGRTGRVAHARVRMEG
jgi:hypothetical protein